jgi:dihydroxy-acid dehydratase
MASASRGAVIKQSVISNYCNTGRAIVSSSVEDMLRIDDPNLDVTADDVLVLRNAGPKGAPGMEAGYLPIRKIVGWPASRTWCGFPRA